MNVKSESDTISSGKPWFFHTLSRYTLATVGESFFPIGIKCGMLVNRSTTSRTIVAPSDSGRLVIKSVLIRVQGLHANSKVCTGTCFASLGAFVLWQLSHSLQYFRMSRSIFVQYKFWVTNYRVHSIPKCPATFESRSDMIILHHSPSGIYILFSPHRITSLSVKFLPIFPSAVNCLHNSSARTLVSVWNTRVFRTALAAL